jgi:hypothetical protein
LEQNAHPLMAPHVPGFITPPGETDTLLVAVGIFLVLMVIGVGILYFRLHALPEQLSHRGNSKAQFEIVAVLALLALFTHTTAFWVAALILAMIPLPDFLTPLNTMSSALTDMARNLWQRSAPAASAEAASPVAEPAQTAPSQPEKV